MITHCKAGGIYSGKKAEWIITVHDFALHILK
jgi:hypothetical protein